jgi:hypothetical protein
VAASLTLGNAPPARATTKPASPHPGTTWETASPPSVGLDAKELDRIAATAKKGKSNCLVVVLLARAGWTSGTFDVGMWLAVAVAGLGVLGSL